MNIGYTKRDLVGRLLLAVKVTRAGDNIQTMLLSDDEETVTIFYKSGGSRQVSVACDSGIALMRDVLNVIN